MKTLITSVLVLITACGTGGTSLEGTIDCGSFTCAPGELCMTLYAGVDAAVPQGPSLRCAMVASDCRVEDCAGDECRPCLVQLCGGAVIVEGRSIVCRGA